MGFMLTHFLREDIVDRRQRHFPGWNECNLSGCMHEPIKHLCSLRESIYFVSCKIFSLCHLRPIKLLFRRNRLPSSVDHSVKSSPVYLHVSVYFPPLLPFTSLLLLQSELFSPQVQYAHQDLPLLLLLLSK